MPYYNASQAARELNVPDKTIRRWLKQGMKGRWKLTAQRTESGQLLISEADILRIKHAREQERAQFDRSGSPVPSKVDMPSQDLADLSQQVTQLTAKVVRLEERITTLESAHQSPPNRDEIPLVRPSPQPATADIPPKTKPPIRNVDASNPVPTDLPPDTLSASDFAAILEIPYEHMKNYMRRGVNGEHLDITKIPHHTRPGYMQKYLDPEQQERAIELLRKHGKLS